MKRVIILVVVLWTACLCGAHAAEVDLTWDANPEPDIAGYRVYQSIDMGANWTMVADTNATTVNLSDIPDTGLILFRVSAYDNQDESIRHNAGAWFNNDWIPISTPKSSGIE